MKLSLLSRFLTYQKERFPFLMYIIIISVFSFSAISYSLLCRGVDAFIAPGWFVLCVFNAVIIFFLLRVSDEFKDQEDDANYRKYLPVPRGLIALNELRWIGIGTVALQLGVTGYFEPRMLVLLFGVYAYMFLMYHEFFVKSWLKKHQFWYVVSHMMIIPLVDVFASGFDWFLKDEPAPLGLLLFFAVSFFNGLTLEIGRKIKSPEQEEPGVLSYTFQVGTKRAVYLWLGVLTITYLLTCYACFYVGHAVLSYYILSAVLVLAWIPAVLFLKNPNPKSAKGMEYLSSLWTFTMYLTIGGVPMLSQIF
jgi:4-hydroxybenzoate polyprenyltransferase